jgi:hypothetical protein
VTGYWGLHIAIDGIEGNAGTPADERLTHTPNPSIRMACTAPLRQPRREAACRAAMDRMHGPMMQGIANADPPDTAFRPEVRQGCPKTSTLLARSSTPRGASASGSSRRTSRNREGTAMSTNRPSAIQALPAAALSAKVAIDLDHGSAGSFIATSRRRSEHRRVGACAATILNEVKARHFPGQLASPHAAQLADCIGALPDAAQQKAS